MNYFIQESERLKYRRVIKSNLKGANSKFSTSPFEVGVHSTVNPFEVVDNVSKIISNQFSKLFNSYTQAINKAYGRTGSLFEHPFRRIAVTEDSYFSRLVTYINENPEKHGIVKDFRDYLYSSYQAHLLEKNTKLNREEVLEWFGGKEQYISSYSDEKKSGMKRLDKEWFLE